MTVRYFNLKQGSEKVSGGIIKVNTSKQGLEKLTDFSGDFGGTGYNFEFLKRENGCEVYEISIPNEKIIAYNYKGAVISAPIDVGKPLALKLKLDEKGKLSLYSETKKVYLEEISENSARKLQEDGSNWALQRAYIVE